MISSPLPATAIARRDTAWRRDCAIRRSAGRADVARREGRRGCDKGEHDRQPGDRRLQLSSSSADTNRSDSALHPLFGRYSRRRPPRIQARVDRPLASRQADESVASSRQRARLARTLRVREVGRERRTPIRRGRSRGRAGRRRRPAPGRGARGLCLVSATCKVARADGAGGGGPRTAGPRLRADLSAQRRWSRRLLPGSTVRVSVAGEPREPLLQRVPLIAQGIPPVRGDARGTPRHLRA